MFYAYDKMTGAVVHEVQLPANTCGNPMTYMVNGKQYIVVAVGAQTCPPSWSRCRCRSSTLGFGL